MTKLYDNRWRFIRNLGQGGQGSVVLVSDQTGQIPGELALKRLINADSQERLARFERETSALETLNHPNILKIHHRQLEPMKGEKPFFVAEYCSGGSLQTRDAGAFRDNVARAAAIMGPIIQALSATHAKGIFHRDCKPGNVLFRSDNTPVLCDFGICYMEDGELVTLSDAGMGSKNFIAPEMEAGGTGNVSEAVDVYSLAKMLYWMVSGGRVLGRENHRGGANNLAATIDRQRFEHLHKFLDRFLQMDPSERESLISFGVRLKDLVMLIDGDFVPLDPKLAIRCRFCGLGTYERSVKPLGYSIPDAGLQVPASERVAAMWCNHCGHIQSFNLKAASHGEWWNGKKPL